ncbi:MAG: zinc ribbon domain-containing protein [Lentilactobacillus hilgardii]|uniref:Zinc-ribbon domain-containing protein n=1 Tax=Lentilactobacillus hilgardii TaxID=1588 RepID=A0A6P1E2V2_LENHI|nr:zinc ribbon domain-containing protein [Lentilactobacillus hilgardii]RRG08864.1 MAG: zinc ribbon domain-containing protein [Lactobacillus sp.]MBZ2201529.1 hypothetical protein [Lentilactobacillus hilgardii]MBZ2204447.1 hypothetical protein [Lentilactobacillus hilgardii]MCT3392923.1 zinc ribbon domain-containing protein [Lentilactobacillus hilgardii]MCT3400207.1 zinc ribbon domain-containing protein [Lentilactobacillus hilgardii]
MENEFKFCPKCGAKVKANAKFCPKCGNRFIEMSQNRSSNDQSNAGSSQPQNMASGKKPFKHRNWLIAGVIAVIVVIVTVTIASSIITKQQTQAKKTAMIQSSQLKESIKKKKEAKENKTEKQLAHESVDVVTDMIQNDWDLDAECDDVTITSSYGGNQYGGYASVSDDDGDQTTVDVTVTNVKYDHNVSVEIDGDGHDTLNNTFDTYDDEDDDY